MRIFKCSKEDFDQIICEITEFWRSDRTLYLHHPMFIYEFGNTAYVIKEGEKVIGYLLGFISQTEPTAYVHLIGIRRSHQRRGLGRLLYDHFISYARKKGCKTIKAITTHTNLDSIAFHKSIGMELLGSLNEEGIPVVKDYGGPGRDRVVFRKRI